VQQIFPAPSSGLPIAAGDAVGALAALYAYPEPAGRPWLRANMVASADGAAAADGRSGGLSGAADRQVFSVLRSLADVILVGAGTARAERYRPVRLDEAWPRLRAGRTPTPPIAVVTRALDLEPGEGLLASAPDTARTLVLTTEAAPPGRVAAVGAGAEVIVAGEQTVTAAAAAAALGARGHRRILVEGGPGLLAQITAAGLLDELCLTYSPVLAGGSAGRILAGAGGAGAAQSGPARDSAAAGPQAVGATCLELAHVLEDEGYLLCRYLRLDSKA
jgi:riboflavin biosynthesis pyrimidine reductase